MNDLHRALLELQNLDREIDEAQSRMTSFEPELDALEAPLHDLEKEAESLRTRLDEMKKETRRLERGATEKRAKLEKYRGRLDRVRNAREEAAARTELDLIRKAAEADEREAIEMMEQVTRTELKLDELEERVDATREEVTPRREELLEGRESAEQDLAVLRDRRKNHTVRMDATTRRLYEQVRGGRTNSVLTALTADGACGHCFSMVPIQRQTEIRRGNDLIRCEACGVILYVED